MRDGNFACGTTLQTVLSEKSSDQKSEAANKLVSTLFAANPEDDLISRKSLCIHFELISLITSNFNAHVTDILTVAPRSPRFPARPGVPSLP